MYMYMYKCMYNMYVHVYVRIYTMYCSYTCTHIQCTVHIHVHMCMYIRTTYCMYHWIWFAKQGQAGSAAGPIRRQPWDHGALSDARLLPASCPLYVKKHSSAPCTLRNTPTPCMLECLHSTSICLHSTSFYFHSMCVCVSIPFHVSILIKLSVLCCLCVNLAI